MSRPPKFDAKETAKGVGAYIGLCKANGWLPTVEGLAVQLQVARSTIYKWADDYKAFSDILELLLSQQAAQLIQNGVVGTYNSTITDITSGGAPIIAHRRSTSSPLSKRYSATTRDAMPTAYMR